MSQAVYYQDYFFQLLRTVLNQITDIPNSEEDKDNSFKPSFNFRTALEVRTAAH